MSLASSSCGFDCSHCPVYQATQSGDTDALRELQHRLAAEGQHWSLEEMRCLGCAQNEVLFAYCAQCEKRRR